MGIGYKLLRSDLSSLFDEHGRVQYGPDWVEVPGDGAYVALTLPGLLRGGMGEVLARVEYKSPTGAVDDGEVVTARRVRILQHAPVDVWAFVRAAIWGARQVLPPKNHPLREVCLRTLEAAERCERERTAEAAEAAAAWMTAASGAARWAAESAKQASWGAKRAARWAVVKATDAAADAARAAKRAADGTMTVVVVAAAAASAREAADAARGTDLARRILERLVDQVLPSEGE